MSTRRKKKKKEKKEKEKNSRQSKEDIKRRVESSEDQEKCEEGCNVENESSLFQTCAIQHRGHH
jgi:hypothetical protein